MESPVFIGIDPGISGAIAAVDHRGRIISAHHLPVIKDGSTRRLHIARVAKMLREMTEDNPTCFVAVEKVHSMPKQGVRSSFRFGEAFGLLQGIAVGLSLPLVLVRPQEWKKQFLRFIDADDQKARSVIAASFRWPDLDLPLKKDHNKADAAFLAEYCRMYHQNKLED